MAIQLLHRDEAGKVQSLDVVTAGSTAYVGVTSASGLPLVIGWHVEPDGKLTRTGDSKGSTVAFDGPVKGLRIVELGWIQLGYHGDIPARRLLTVHRSPAGRLVQAMWTVDGTGDVSCTDVHVMHYTVSLDPYGEPLLAVGATRKDEWAVAFADDSGNLRVLRGRAEGGAYPDRIDGAGAISAESAAGDVRALGTAWLLDAQRLVTAVRTASDAQKVIRWDLPATSFTVTRDGPGVTGPEPISRVAVVGTGGRCVTAARTSTPRLRLTAWSATAATAGSPDSVGAADRLSLTTASPGHVVSAVRTREKQLLVTRWYVDDGAGTIERLDDAVDAAVGTIGDARVTRVAGNVFVTAVTDAESRLRLASWEIG